MQTVSAFDGMHAPLVFDLSLLRGDTQIVQVDVGRAASSTAIIHGNGVGPRLQARGGGERAPGGPAPRAREGQCGGRPPVDLQGAHITAIARSIVQT